MAQIALRDLKNKPHNLTLKDGSVLRIKPRERVVIEDRQVSDIIVQEVQRGYLGYSKLPVAVSSPKMTQTTTYKSSENTEKNVSEKAETETSNNNKEKSAKKNK